MALQRALRFFEFFAGAGLVRLGLAPAWHVQWANDNDPRKAEGYTKNFSDQDLLCCDIAIVSAHDLPVPVQMAWASFPCQDLSLAGWRRGITAARSGTFWTFWQLMADLQERGTRPPIIVLENVPGLLYGDDFLGLCEALASLNLQFGALVIDAKHFVPQSRARVFVIAVDATINVDAWTVPESDRCRPWVPHSLQNAYRRLPDALQHHWVWWKVPVPTHPPASLDSLIDSNPPNAVWHSAEETERLLAMMTPHHRDKIVHALHEERSVGTLYRRTRHGQQRAEVRFDGIAGCLRTPDGGSSRQTIIEIRNGLIATRLLTPREAARLMGVPDTFWLPQHYNNAYRAMGDGVVVPVVRWLSEHLLTPIAQTLPQLSTFVRATPNDRKTG